MRGTRRPGPATDAGWGSAPKATAAPSAVQHEHARKHDHATASLVHQRALSALVLATACGCAAVRGQEAVGACVDDSAITAAVKARFVESKVVDTVSIGVETLDGTVVRSGFAKSRAPRRSPPNR